MNNTSSKPTRPIHIPDYAEVCLRALAEDNLGDKISMGGAFALLHYLDYRATFDVDAWWSDTATTKDRERVIEIIKGVLGAYGQVRRRSFGDVTSIELDTDRKKKVFSFQIAERSALLQTPVKAQWSGILLDSFPDLVASKMNALIQRGAPRDFRDIHAICQANMVTPLQCWHWWRQRQQLTNDDADVERAKVAIVGHLERIEQYRPLTQIGEQGQRQEAARVRQWYREVFLDDTLA